MAHQSRCVFSFAELLENPGCHQPLIVKGRRCHGGPKQESAGSVSC